MMTGEREKKDVQLDVQSVRIGLSKLFRSSRKREPQQKVEDKGNGKKRTR